MKPSQRFSKLVLFAGVMTMVSFWGMDQVEGTTDLLDGKTFIVHQGFKGKEASSEDEIVFRKGKLYSADCAEWGFDRGDYTATVKGDTVFFEAETRSPKHGKIRWKGQVNGDTLSGIFIWTKKRWYWKDARQEKWLKGTLKK